MCVLQKPRSPATVCTYLVPSTGRPCLSENEATIQKAIVKGKKRARKLPMIILL